MSVRRPLVVSVRNCSRLKQTSLLEALRSQERLISVYSILLFLCFFIIIVLFCVS